MRELKFRLYDLTMGMYRVLDSQHDTFFILGDGSLEYYNLQNGSGGVEYIIEQFTGLLDKNGKMIFEGDIVQYTTSVEKGTAKISSWIGNNLYFEWINSPEAPTNADIFGCAKELEVIGTIHDTEYKELAK